MHPASPEGVGTMSCCAAEPREMPAPSGNFNDLQTAQSQEPTKKVAIDADEAVEMRKRWWLMVKALGTVRVDVRGV